MIEMTNAAETYLKIPSYIENKGIRDAGSTADFRILFEIFEILEVFDFFKTFNFFDIFESF